MPPRSTVDVTLVLVAHDGERWLPEVLSALAAMTVRPRRTIAVDTGSTDGTAALLAAATGTCVDRVLSVSRRLGYGSAVAAGLAAEPDASGGPSAWLWLLHDDSAPAPDALERLLAHAADSPSAALLGPKVLDWDDPRVLVEVGLTTDRAGHRETGLERREYDQGQHDAVRDVLAVGTAGALVRRAVWDDLDGLDPALPVFRDDLDLGWRVNAAGARVVVVPEATVRHARWATLGGRRLHAVRGRPEAIDRRHALLVLLGHASTAALPLLLLRLAVATVLRVLGFLLTRQPLKAADEMFEAASVLLRPSRIRAARRLRARTRTVPTSALRPLFASPRARARLRAEALGGWLTGSAARAGGLDGLPPTAGHEPEDAYDVEPVGGSLLRRILSRPPVLMVLGLLAVALVAGRSLLPLSGGLLSGGRLLPAPGGATDLWAAYAASWHPVSVGSDAPAPPLLAALALLATVLLGKAWLAVDMLLLGSIPLAGAAAYAATRTVVRSRTLRVWAAVTWALLPVGTGALAAGRLDAAAAQIGLPLLLVAGARLVRDDPARAGWRR
ncbi:MAG TPA: glycosyltransferase family 2 protein, partial [Mycobacteriales bacterium]|nr:glycosyltransferase family 2 protein [Mycobacteriales bacterium]